MYVTVRGGPTEVASGQTDSTTGAAARAGLRRRVPGTVVALGFVSFFTDISSESVNAILPLYITAVLGMGPLAYGFIDGIYQGVSAAVRILGGWWADSSRRPKWVAFAGYGLSALSRIALHPGHRVRRHHRCGRRRPARQGTAYRPAGRHDRRRLGPGSARPELRRPPGAGHRRSADRTADRLRGACRHPDRSRRLPTSVFVFSAAFAVIGLAVLVIAVPGRRRRAAVVPAASCRRGPTAALA